MEEDRPAKRTVRKLWLEVVDSQRSHSGKEPLYLTMPGAVGREIELLVESGILRQRETGAIVEADAQRVVAVESSPNAMAELKKRFPGLSAVGESIQGLLKGSDLSKMPEGVHRKRCQAKVVNLDFNKPLGGTTHKGVPVWDELALIAKLGTLHREIAEPWFLFLTINAGITWAQAVQHAAVRFINENIQQREQFRSHCERVMGDDLLALVVDKKMIPDAANPRDRQRFLMAFVPKRIAWDASVTGWRLSTLENIHYGNDQGQAAMVTWIFRFDWDERTSSTPGEVYGEAVDSSLIVCSELTTDGEKITI